MYNCMFNLDINGYSLNEKKILVFYNILSLLIVLLLSFECYKICY